jgi:hypothetical protein
MKRAYSSSASRFGSCSRQMCLIVLTRFVRGLIRGMTVLLSFIDFAVCRAGEGGATPTMWVGVAPPSPVSQSVWRVLIRHATSRVFLNVRPRSRGQRTGHRWGQRVVSTLAPVTRHPVTSRIARKRRATQPPHHVSAMTDEWSLATATHAVCSRGNACSRRNTTTRRIVDVGNGGATACSARCALREK